MSPLTPGGPSQGLADLLAPLLKGLGCSPRLTASIVEAVRAAEKALRRWG